jgi:hypothetical protein
MAHTKSADSIAVPASSNQREREPASLAAFALLICRSMNHLPKHETLYTGQAARGFVAELSC